MAPLPHSAPPAPPWVPSGWTASVSVGPACPFHHRELPARPEVWLHLVDRPALVLGSTQPEADIDRARAEAEGVEVCRRRSGGGLVTLSPGADCWLDVIVPRTSSLWDDDVGRAFDWLGHAWARAVDTLTATPTPAAATAPDPPPNPNPNPNPNPTPVTDGAVAHRGALEGGDAGRMLCFASLGPGEVTLGGHKVVGISQRRTRLAARFQSIAVGRWDPSLALRYLDPERLAAIGLDPARVPVGVGDAPWPDPLSVATEVCRHLPPIAFDGPAQH